MNTSRILFGVSVLFLFNYFSIQLKKGTPELWPHPFVVHESFKNRLITSGYVNNGSVLYRSILIVQRFRHGHAAWMALIRFPYFAMKSVDAFSNPASLDTMVCAHGVIMLMSHYVEDQILHRWIGIPRASRMCPIGEMNRTIMDLVMVYMVYSLITTVMQHQAAAPPNQEVVIVQSTPNIVVFLNLDDQEADVYPINHLPILTAAGVPVNVVQNWNGLPQWALESISDDADEAG